MNRRRMLALTGMSLLPWRAEARDQKKLAVFLGYPASDPFSAVAVGRLQSALKESRWPPGERLDVRVWYWDGSEAGLQDQVVQILRTDPDIIVASHTPIAHALAKATSKIPIVFAVVSDPVGIGIVDSFGKPGRNVTGFSNVDFAMGGKLVDLLLEVVPGLTSVGALINSVTAKQYGFYAPAIEEASRRWGKPVRMSTYSGMDELKKIIDRMALENSGLVLFPDASNAFTHRDIIAWANERHVPMIATNSTYTKEGCMLSYGVSRASLFQQAGNYVARILDGSRPADLPVVAPSVFELSINLKTAQALHVTVPPALLSLADEVVE